MAGHCTQACHTEQVPSRSLTSLLLKAVMCLCRVYMHLHA